jgi:hypothetical protein
MNRDFFRTDIARGGEINIDRENGVIKGFSVVTKGVTKDSRGEFDESALNAVVDLGNKTGLGVKSRFGHPNMSGTALGTFLGRVKDFRRAGDIVRADLHIDQTAFDTPDGDLAGYVLNLAESDPAMFGASMVINWDEEEREELDADGKKLPPFIRVKKLLSVDVVDDPAANNGFFGDVFFADSVLPSAELTAFLDRFLNSPEAVEKTIGFLNRYSVNRETVNDKPREGKTMKDVTLEQLKTERKDLFDAAYSEGETAGRDGERDRVVSILKKAQTFEGMQEASLEAVEKGVSAEQAEITFREKRLENLEKTSAPEVGPDAEEEPKKEMSHLDRAKAFQKENGGTLTDALKATAEEKE